MHKNGKSVVYLNRATGDPKQPMIVQPAIVISVLSSPEFKAETGEPGLNILTVAPGKESLLGGADFTHALERIYGVKHANHTDVADGKELAFYTLDSSTEEGRASYPELQAEIEKLASFLLEQYSGEIKLDESPVDIVIRLLKKAPTPADLDQVAGEQKAAAATAGQTGNFVSPSSDTPQPPSSPQSGDSLKAEATPPPSTGADQTAQ